MNFKRIASAAAALLIAVSLLLCGCGKTVETPVETTETVSVEPGEDGYKYHFTLEVIDAEGNQSLTDIATDKEILGEVLSEHEIIKGEEGPYGLYIKEVNGIVADYETTGTYWAFYVNGEMAMKGIDQTEITDGATYTLKVE